MTDLPRTDPYGAHRVTKPEPKPRRKLRWLPWALAAVALLIAVVSCVSSYGTRNDPRPAPITVPPTTSTVAPAVAPNPATIERDEPTQDGPRARFDDGTYEVGTDIAPGKYRTAGPTPGHPHCYWARLKDASGELSDILANDNTAAATIVTIRSSDKYFKTDGCQTWVRA